MFLKKKYFNNLFPLLRWAHSSFFLSFINQFLNDLFLSIFFLSLKENILNKSKYISVKNLLNTKLMVQLAHKAAKYNAKF